MAKETLGETIDIHCGGVDLKFPHHENEIAQSECAHGKPMARYWVHNNFLNMGTEKMSKSVGNIKLISELLEDWDGEVIRLALLKAHYRSELIWTDKLLEESKAQLDGWYRKKQWFGSSQFGSLVEDLAFIELVCDDLNIPQSFGRLSVLDQSIGELNNKFVEERDAFWTNELQDSPVGKTAMKFFMSLDLLGLLQKDPEDWFKGNTSDDDEARIDALIQERLDARANKDWARGDEIRDQLASEGIVLEDSAGATTWRRE